MLYWCVIVFGRQQCRVSARPMQGALLLVWAALLAAHALPTDLTTQPTAGGRTHSFTTIGKLNETLSMTSTTKNVLFAQGNKSKTSSFSDESTTRSSSNNFSSRLDTEGRKYVVQVAPIPVVQRARDTYVPIPGRVPTEQLNANFSSKTRLRPSSLTNNKQDIKLSPKLQIQLEDLTEQTPLDTYNVSNKTEKHALEPKYHDYFKVDYSPEIKSTTKRSIEPKVWTEEVWPKSYTDTVQSFTIKSRDKLIPILEISNESWLLNETFEDVILPGSAVQIPEFSHDLVPGSSDPVLQASSSVETWADYSGEQSARAEQQQFAASLKSLMRAGGNKTGRAEREHDVDLVLSGERALVQLWPQFGDLLEQLLQLASDTCKSIPLVPLISQYQGNDTPNLKMIIFSARGKRVLRAGDTTPSFRETADMVVVYVPGWWNTPSDSAARALRDALVPVTGALLVLDTRAAFCRPYLSAAARVQRVAEYLARWVLRSGLPPARLHLLGFSLGAHVAALAALRVRAAAGLRLGRVSALEPAAPCLRAGGWRRGANHVQVVHTSRSLALRRPLGHADVYAAVRCAPACQHAAAWRLFAASARDPAALTAPRCLRPRDLAAGACHGHNATLGFRCAPDARGIFFLQPP